MRKSKIKFVIILLSIVVLSGCTRGTDVAQSVSENNSKTDEPIQTNRTGENTMEEKLLTKEKFVQAIQENDLGVTMEDFEGVEIEDFISEYYISQEVIEKCISGDLILGGFLKGYIDHAPLREREKQLAPYLVWELKYVESTEEEYQAFIESYFVALQKNAEYIRQEENGVDIYMVDRYNENSTLFFNFCQTSKSKDLPIALGSVHKNYMIELNWEEGGIFNLDIYYSKNGKYLMYIDGRYEFETYEEWLHIIKTFCELED